MPKRKTRYHHGDLRRALMDAALATVAEGGLASLSLREAARRAGVSTAAPYHHFESVDALAGALCEEGFASLDAAMRAAQDAAGDDPRDRMRALGRAYVRFASTHPAHFRLMFGAAPRDAALAAPSPDALPAFGLMLSALRAMQSAGLAPPGPVAPMALLAWTSVHGLAALLLDGPLAGGLMGLAPAALDDAVTRVTVDALEAMARAAAPPVTGRAARAAAPRAAPPPRRR